jgi:hypothetical protein
MSNIVFFFWLAASDLSLLLATKTPGNWIAGRRLFR